MTRKVTLIVAAIAATLASAVPVTAADNMFDSSSRTVRYDDLDLRNESGRQRLQERISNAVEAVCGHKSERSLAEKMAANRCRAATMAMVQPKYVAAIRTAGAVYAARAD